MKQKLLCTLYIFLFVSNIAHATTPNINVVGQIPITLQTKDITTLKQDLNIPATKSIMLQKIILSSDAKSYIAKHFNKKNNKIFGHSE